MIDRTVDGLAVRSDSLHPMIETLGIDFERRAAARGVTQRQPAAGGMGRRQSHLLRCVAM
jgi:hypothetical protein